MNTHLFNQLKKYAVQTAIVLLLVSASFGQSVGTASARFIRVDTGRAFDCSRLPECGYIMMHSPQVGSVSIPVTGGIAKLTPKVCLAGAKVPYTMTPLYVGMGYELTFSNCDVQFQAVNR